MARMTGSNHIPSRGGIRFCDRLDQFRPSAVSTGVSTGSIALAAPMLATSTMGQVALLTSAETAAAGAGLKWEIREAPLGERRDIILTTDHIRAKQDTWVFVRKIAANFGDRDANSLHTQYVFYDQDDNPFSALVVKNHATAGKFTIAIENWYTETFPSLALNANLVIGTTLLDEATAEYDVALHFSFPTLDTGNLVVSAFVCPAGVESWDLDGTPDATYTVSPPVYVDTSKGIGLRAIALYRIAVVGVGTSSPISNVAEYFLTPAASRDDRPFVNPFSECRAIGNSTTAIRLRMVFPPGWWPTNAKVRVEYGLTSALGSLLTAQTILTNKTAGPYLANQRSITGLPNNTNIYYRFNITTSGDVAITNSEAINGVQHRASTLPATTDSNPLRVCAITCFDQAWYQHSDVFQLVADAVVAYGDNHVRFLGDDGYVDNTGAGFLMYPAPGAATANGSWGAVNGAVVEHINYRLEYGFGTWSRPRLFEVAVVRSKADDHDGTWDQIDRVTKADAVTEVEDDPDANSDSHNAYADSGIVCASQYNTAMAIRDAWDISSVNGLVSTDRATIDADGEHGYQIVSGVMMIDLDTRFMADDTDISDQGTVTVMTSDKIEATQLAFLLAQFDAAAADANVYHVSIFAQTGFGPILARGDHIHNFFLGQMTYIEEQWKARRRPGQTLSWVNGDDHGGAFSHAFEIVDATYPTILDKIQINEQAYGLAFVCSVGALNSVLNGGRDSFIDPVYMSRVDYGWPTNAEVPTANWVVSGIGAHLEYQRGGTFTSRTAYRFDADAAMMPLAETVSGGRLRVRGGRDNLRVR